MYTYFSKQTFANTQSWVPWVEVTQPDDPSLVHVEAEIVKHLESDESLHHCLCAPSEAALSKTIGDLLTVPTF